MRVLPPNADESNLLMRWNAYINALAQKDFVNPESDNIHRILSSKVRLILLATPFCCSVSRTVKCLSMLASRHSCRNGSLVYFPLLSELSTLIFLPVCFSIWFFHFTNNSRSSSMCLMLYTQQCLKKLSINDTKWCIPLRDVILVGPKILVWT